MAYTAVIAGASSDTGIAYTEHLLKRFPEACIYAHGGSRTERLYGLAEKYPLADIKVLKADLLKKEEREGLAAALKGVAADAFLFLPAGRFSYMRLKDAEEEYFTDAFSIQVLSFADLAKVLLPDMKKRGGRALVMLTEYVTMELPPRFMSDYIAAKYALLGLMKAAASEYGGKDLKINAIAPSMMDTSFLNGMDPKIKELEIYKNGRILSPADLFKDMDELLFGECEENGCIRLVRP